MNAAPSSVESVSRSVGEKGTGTTSSKTMGGLSLRSDWASLTGHTVEVWLLGAYIARGVVDQAAEDHSVLWLAGTGADTRRLFDKGSGYQIWG